eukprot:CAMPEP_0113706740 /NCGR_PEP_ID=MMETSP0038_2-20120614/27922_1 /TAXON_ID=2898 /ORGANISM="Cryptomonas paramecium" /LENGTH=39 /DNA_ID=CAMNT_0000632025 /DNA_START=169 /DNA_END=284 /DNA_ORIENTATION=+ /assembly_acc=CAM_ASM_000170
MAQILIRSLVLVAALAHAASATDFEDIWELPTGGDFPPP